MRTSQVAWLFVAAAFGAAMFLVGGVLAQDGGEEAPPAGGFAGPEWMQLTKEHESLARYAGDWDVAMRFQMAPEAPWTEVPGKTSSRLVMGGRFVTQEFEADMMGMPYAGHQDLGYDTVTKEWVSIWYDNMSPLISISRGVENDGVIRFLSEGPDHQDPTGKKKPVVITLEWAGDDQYTVRFFSVVGETETEAGTMVYTRVTDETE